MAKVIRNIKDDHQKNIVKMLNSLEGSHSRWEIWQDFITMSAISISSAVDIAHREQRKKMYLAISKKYSKREMAVFPEMFAEVVNGIDINPDQDFLGELFMALELSNEWKGQFFTPYDVCRAMAAMTAGGKALKERIAQQGWISVNDPACGAGALLLAFANECRGPDIGVNYQTSVIFVAQDIDFLAGCMCYIQLSLMGCPGYVVIDDSIMRPSTSYDSRGLIPRDDGNVWYTPFYFRPEWHWRRIWTRMDKFCVTAAPLVEATPPPSEPPHLIEPPLTETETGQLTLF